MINLLGQLVITVVVIGLLYWITTLFPLPAPFPKIIQVVFAVIALIVVLNVLFALTGTGGLFWHPVYAPR